jgi:hypothetical protein
MRQSPAAAPLPATLKRASRNGARFLECAGSLAVDAILAALGDVGDRLADQGAARRAFHPEDEPVGAGLPAKGVGGVGLLRLGFRDGVGPALPERFDPGDELADLGLAGSVAGAVRGSCAADLGSAGVDGAGKGEVACAEAGQRLRDDAAEVAPVPSSERAVGAQRGKQIDPLLLAQRAPATRGAATDG